MQAKSARRLPQRTCIACRSTDSKREFVRVVRTPDGAVELDLTGKQPGRGAYVCKQVTCWQNALKKGRFEAALKVKLTPGDRQKLTDFATALKEPAAIS
jgi:predicted RNA-binding protein YlxR (DUF448 family)